MTMNRRMLFAAFAGAAGAMEPALAGDQRSRPPAGGAQAKPAREFTPSSIMEASTLGVRANADDDQTTALQRAINRAADARAVLHLPPGTYRTAALQLPPYAAVAGVRGATRLVMAGGSSLLTSTGGDHISLSGLTLDGADIPLPDRQGLVHLSQGESIRITRCEFADVAGNGILLEGIGGEVTDCSLSAGAAALWSIDARGLRIVGNTVRAAGDNGIQIWRSSPGDDGTLVVDNRIEDITNKSGGSGQWGNAISVFRAANVIVRGNRIHNTAYSAVRGNSSSNLQIIGNTCTRIGEVALYAEFSFEGAIIAHNIVDGAAVGVSVTNFKDHGGRLATVQGNLIRNLIAGRPPGNDQSNNAAYGITAEADTMVSGNVIESVEGIGISAGWGPSLRDVAITGNIVRDADYAIAVSVASGAGSAMIADNLISGARRGAIVGMEWTKLVAANLDGEDGARFAQLTIGKNSVR